MPGAGLSSATEVFLTGLTEEVNKEDVSQMVTAQQHMMMRFEKTNEMLLNFNMLSAARYDATQREFKKHTLLLTDMKKDLDSIFGRIRILKTKLNKQHPEAFKVCSDGFDKLEEEEGEDERDITPTQPTAPFHPRADLAITNPPPRPPAPAKSLPPRSPTNKTARSALPPDTAAKSSLPPDTAAKSALGPDIAAKGTLPSDGHDGSGQDIKAGEKAMDSEVS